MFKQKGFTIVESLISASLAIVLTVSGVYAINQYTQNQDLNNRSLSTADQLVAVAEASYKLVASEGGFNSDIISISDLKSGGLLDESFPNKTPYGQVIKSFVIENPNDSTLYDVLVSTSGDPEEAFVSRSGQTEDSFERIQQETYESMRRETLDVDGGYYFGVVENEEFASAGNLFVRDVSTFSADLGSNMQASILLVSPNNSVELVPQVQAIIVRPESGIPANGSRQASITISVRHQDGTPAEGKQIVWDTTGGVLSASSGQTDVQGIASVKLKSSVAGAITVSARVLENGATEDVVVTFVPPEVVSLSASPKSNVNADGVMCSSLVATLAYPDGTKASNEPLQWITNIGTYKGTTSTTNSQGEASACLTSDREGTANARAKATRSNDENNIGITFIGPRIASNAIWASPSSGIPANGSDYSRIKVRATYPDGKRASGVKISWTANNGGILNRSKTYTNSNGETTVVLRNNREGSTTVTARTPQGVARRVTVGFDAARVVSIWANKTAEIPADNKTKATVYARVQYPNGTRAINEIVHWSRSRGTLDHTATRTNSNGVAANRIRSNSEGNSRVMASYGGTSKAINVSFEKTAQCTPNEEWIAVLTGPDEHSLVKDTNRVVRWYCDAESCWNIGIGQLIYTCAPDGSKWNVAFGYTRITWRYTRNASVSRNQSGLIPFSYIEETGVPIDNSNLF